MKAKFILLGILILEFSNLASQTWVQRANLPGAARTNSVAFSIGTKAYIATGYDGTNHLNDLWEYTPSTDSWFQKTSMPGEGREGAVAFVIGTKAYIATGQGDTSFLRDMWEWDQTTDTWLQRANFPGTKRSEAAAFAVGTKGYVGTGFSGVNCFDFYEWNQTTNTWLARANFPVNARNSAMGFSLNNGKGCIGGGYASGNVYQDIYEYNPVNNTWAFLGMTNYMAYSVAHCAIQNYAFYGTGIDDNAQYYNNFSSFDLSNGSMGLTPFGGSIRYNAISCAVGFSVFMGTGFDGWYTQDWWEYATTLGEKNQDLKFKVECFPNPATDKLNIETSAKEVFIFDVLGNLILSEKIIGEKTVLDISGLQPGIYFIRTKDLGASHFIKQ